MHEPKFVDIRGFLGILLQFSSGMLSQRRNQPLPRPSCQFQTRVLMSGEDALGPVWCAAAPRHKGRGAQVPPLKFVIVLAGFPPQDAQLAALFSRPLALPSLHIIGERDVMKHASAKLLSFFQVHTDIWHRQGTAHPGSARPSKRTGVCVFGAAEQSPAPPHGARYGHVQSYGCVR